MNAIERVVRGIDEFHQRHGVVAAGFGVVNKYGDDRGAALAGLLAYSAFVAVFQLLLLLVTLLGFVLRHHPGLARDVLDSALADFPIIGTQLANSIHPLRGSGPALAGSDRAGVGFARGRPERAAGHGPGVERPGQGAAQLLEPPRACANSACSGQSASGWC